MMRSRLERHRREKVKESIKMMDIVIVYSL